MKLFCRHSTCRECGVMFKPRKDEYTDLCYPHAKPHLDKDARRKNVVYWAEANWERLEEQKNKEQAEELAKVSAISQETFQRMAEQMRPMQPHEAGMGQYGGGAIGGLFGGGHPFRTR